MAEGKAVAQGRNDIAESDAGASRRVRASKAAPTMNYDVPVPSSKGYATKQYDCAMTKGEYESQGRTSPEPQVELTEEETQEVLFKDHLCKKKATLQLIMSHRTEWERRLMHFQHEEGISGRVGSEWIEALEEVQEGL